MPASVSRFFRLALLIALAWPHQLLLSPPAPAAEAPAAEEPVVVRPAEIDDLLANPGIGWETFNRTRQDDTHLPPWIPSRIAYYRWGWNQLEPKPGQIDESLLDATLAACRAAGQKLALRVKCCNPVEDRPDHPAWLTDVGGHVLLVDYAESGPTITIPDMGDPVVLERHRDFIKRLGSRYDGHPDLDHVDVGSVGWWGEWHLSRSKLATLPSVDIRQRVIDAYVAAFRKTPLIMLIGAGESTAYAIRQGTGWRADSLGDLGSFSSTWNHMQDRYPAAIRDNHMADAWRHGPVAFEPPHNVSEFVAKGWPLRTIFDYALALHGSSFNGKSASLPDDPQLRAELERFLRRLGYRFVLEELSHPARARAGDAIEVASTWRNIGSAPCYRPYRVAYRLTDTTGRSRVFVGKTRVEHWMPGSVPPFLDAFAKDTCKVPPDLPPGEIQSLTDTLELPADLPPGDARFSVAIVGEADDLPVVRLAIEGRDADGWYPVSRVQIGPPR